eukprot:2632748-Pleurochrysis_carterae.AAC.1
MHESITNPVWLRVHESGAGMSEVDPLVFGKGRGLEWHYRALVAFELKQWQVYTLQTNSRASSLAFRPTDECAVSPARLRCQVHARHSNGKT